MHAGIMGSGVIGEAIIKGLMDRGLFKNNEIIASDIDHKRRNYLGKVFNIEILDDNKEIINKSDIIFIAVKPQVLSSVMDETRGRYRKDQILISVVSGAKLEILVNGFGHNQIIRAMPNTPAKIGEGITVWTSTREAKVHHEFIRTVLSALGDELFVEDEKFIDMATAVSGSGPAYVFLFIEAFIDAAVRIGLSRDMAKNLVHKTITGSVDLLSKTGMHPAELKNMVTSPGGTTAEALLQLEKGGMRALIMEAVLAAYQKTQKLV